MKSIEHASGKKQWLIAKQYGCMLRKNISLANFPVLREEYEEHFFACVACALEVKAAAAFVDNACDVLAAASRVMSHFRPVPRHKQKKTQTKTKKKKKKTTKQKATKNKKKKKKKKHKKKKKKTKKKEKKTKKKTKKKKKQHKHTE